LSGADSGETPRDYRVRIAKHLQPYSDQCKEMALAQITDAKAFENIENMIYADAEREVERPTRIPDGRLTMRTRHGDAGQKIHEFHGEPRTWMDPLAGPVRLYVTAFGTAEERAAQSMRAFADAQTGALRRA
jgi:hypothetical protein